MQPFDALRPWSEIVLDQIPDVELFDAHTHLGQNDPDGMRQAPEELIAGLEVASARGAFVFPMHELDGYAPANDMVLEAARRSDGLLVPFCRVNPHDDPIAEGHCLHLVVRDVDRGGAEALMQFFQFDPHLHPQFGVEVRQRLVEQEHLRMPHDRPTERDALALAAG